MATKLPLSSLTDETAFYAAVGFNATTARVPKPRGPNSGTAYVTGSVAPHDQLENDTLLDMERMLFRTGLAGYEPIAKAWADYFIDVYPAYMDPSATQTAASDRVAGCHTFGAGLAARFRRTGDVRCRDALLQIGGFVEQRYSGVKTEWQVGGNGHRSIGRQLRVAVEVYELTGDARWLTLADKIVSRLLSTTYWDEAKGIFHVGQWSTEHSSTLGPGSWPQAKMYSGIEIPTLADGLIGYLEIGAGAHHVEVHRRLLKTVAWVRQNGLAPYNEYGGLFMAADWKVVGAVYNRQYGDLVYPNIGGGLSPTYTGSWVNLLTWGYLETNDRTYLDRAALHFLRASTIWYGKATESRAQFDSKKIYRYMDSAFFSNTLFLGEPSHGDLFYASALPKVYLDAQQAGDVTAPAAPTLTLGTPVWSDV